MDNNNNNMTSHYGHMGALMGFFTGHLDYGEEKVHEK